MQAPTALEIEAAAQRLRGHLVETPLIGVLHLPGRVLAGDLRVKPEVLQPSGTLYYRGAMHALVRQLGRWKGAALWGEERQVLAAAVAAAQHRLPAVAFPIGEPDAAVFALLQAAGCEVRPRPTAQDAEASAADLRRRDGFHVMPGLDDPDYVAGLATAGLELARGLGRSTECVVVSPAELATPLAMGLAAGGRNLRVEGVDAPSCAMPAALRDAVRIGLRLDVGEPSLAALDWTLSHRAGAEACVVLSS